MKKIIILIPIFNDWESLQKLIIEIDKNINGLNNILFECFIINDASSINQPKLKKPENINKLKVLNMKKNRGHARCNAFGIRYIFQKENFDYLILMDGDGEDRPEEIKSFIEKISDDPNVSVVAKRVKRSEGEFFKFLYLMHKAITYFFTGKKINFGNYSCLTKIDVGKISSEASLWSSYSGTIKKYLINFNSISSVRGKRYFGPSQMSLFKLIIHSFSIIAVFKFQVLLRVILLIIALFYLKTYLGIISFLLQILLIIFSIVIFIVSLREKKKELINSQDNLENIQDVLH